MMRPLITQPGKPACKHAFCNYCFGVLAIHHPSKQHHWDGYAMISVDFKQRGAINNVWVCPICKIQYANQLKDPAIFHSIFTLIFFNRDYFFQQQQQLFFSFIFSLFFHYPILLLYFFYSYCSSQSVARAAFIFFLFLSFCFIPVPGGPVLRRGRVLRVAFICYRNVHYISGPSLYSLHRPLRLHACMHFIFFSLSLFSPRSCVRPYLVSNKPLLSFTPLIVLFNCVAASPPRPLISSPRYTGDSGKIKKKKVKIKVKKKVKMIQSTFTSN